MESMKVGTKTVAVRDDDGLVSVDNDYRCFLFSVSRFTGEDIDALLGKIKDGRYIVADLNNRLPYV